MRQATQEMRQKKWLSGFITDLDTHRNGWTVLEIICISFTIVQGLFHFGRADQLKHEWQQHTCIHMKSGHRVWKRFWFGLTDTQ